MIRQAISCDICGTEKKQTNHWFVAYEQDGELRVSGWSSRKRLRPGSKHLCGQICLHKLVDDFMARALKVNAPQAEADEAPKEAPNEAIKSVIGNDTSLTSSVAFEEDAFEEEDEFGSSARLIPTPEPVQPMRPPLRMPMELVAEPARPREKAVVPADEPPRYASRNWRAAAWERERERERAGERSSSLAARR
jgi:hypothetical protein